MVRRVQPVARDGRTRCGDHGKWRQRSTVACPYRHRRSRESENQSGDDRHTHPLRYGVWNVAWASTKYAPAGKFGDALKRHLPEPSQPVTVTGIVCGASIAANPTRGFTVTFTIVPEGTPDVARSIDVGPGTGRTRSTAPNAPCGGEGTSCPPTAVIATVGFTKLTIAPGPGARVAVGVVLLTDSVLFNASKRTAPGR